MAAGTSPIFVATPKRPQVRISTANTNRDGTGTLGTVATAGADGAYYKGVRIQAEGTTTAGVIRLYVQSAGSGNNELVIEILVTATTPSTTVAAWSYEWFPPAGIVLAATDVFKASTHNGETFSVALEGGGNY
ncbi:MAG: hypothetical protein K2R98_08470 [Gemmataceae bacterium]|nr:hypothetical protein [Gemmataceae bacterium]